MHVRRWWRRSKGWVKDIFADAIKYTFQEAVDSIDSRTRLSRLLTPNTLLVRAVIPSELFNLSVLQFLLKRKLKVVPRRVKLLDRAWHPVKTIYEVGCIIPANGFEREEGPRLTLRPRNFLH